MFEHDKEKLRNAHKIIIGAWHRPYLGDREESEIYREVYKNAHPGFDLTGRDIHHIIDCTAESNAWNDDFNQICNLVALTSIGTAASEHTAIHLYNQKHDDWHNSKGTIDYTDFLG